MVNCMKPLKMIDHYNYPSSSQILLGGGILISNLSITCFVSGPSVSPNGESLSAIKDDRDTEGALPSGVGETEEEIAGLSG